MECVGGLLFWATPTQQTANEFMKQCLTPHNYCQMYLLKSQEQLQGDTAHGTWI